MWENVFNNLLRKFVVKHSVSSFFDFLLEKNAALDGATQPKPFPTEHKIIQGCVINNENCTILPFFLLLYFKKLDLTKTTRYPLPTYSVHDTCFAKRINYISTNKNNVKIVKM